MSSEWFRVAPWRAGEPAGGEWDGRAGCAATCCVGPLRVSCCGGGCGGVVHVQQVLSVGREAGPSGGRSRRPPFGCRGAAVWVRDGFAATLVVTLAAPTAGIPGAAPAASLGPLMYTGHVKDGVMHGAGCLSRLSDGAVLFEGLWDKGRQVKH